jgi:carbonic anhydrase
MSDFTELRVLVVRVYHAITTMTDGRTGALLSGCIGIRKPQGKGREPMSAPTSRRTFVRAASAAIAVSIAIGLSLGSGRAASRAVEPADASAPEFAYSGDNGPGFWGETPGWEACAGTAATARQSPIDIDRIVIDRRLAPLRLQLYETPLTLINNGHTIEQEYEPGSTLALDGLVYELTQFHFHTLSEHTVGGQHGVMELHSVFADPASDRKSVVAMLYVIGRSNHFLSALIAHGLPNKSGNEVNVPSERINLADALTSTSRYYTYPGSLTTPPCSESVRWYVLRDFAQLSQEQLEAFRAILGNDFRPLQKRNGRTVRSSVGDFDRDR